MIEPQTPAEIAADIVSGACIAAVNQPGPAVGQVDTDILRRDITAQIDHMQQLLNGRDEFIVSRGLWQEFVKTVT